MNLFEFLGIPVWASWTIICLLVFVTSVQLYMMFKHKYSKNCRNCGKYSGKTILCDECFQKYKDLFPHEWENLK
jgi:hypothetical protein